MSTDDEDILRRGGDEHDIEQMARQNGADLTKTDFVKEEAVDRIEEMVCSIFTPANPESGRSSFNRQTARKEIQKVVDCLIDEAVHEIEGLKFLETAVSPERLAEKQMHNRGLEKAQKVLIDHKK